MIKVLIERHIAIDLEGPYNQAARKTLQSAMQWPGFISGETLQNAANPNHRFVIATYRQASDWDRWYGSKERKEMMSAIIPMLEDEEKITLLEHI